jgi:predicted DNA-binding transcriptional regulator YafY
VRESVNANYATRLAPLPARFPISIVGNAPPHAYHRVVGQRSQTETLAGIYQAFLQKRTWPQSTLAKELGIGVEPLRRVLCELLDNGMPLSREEDHPHVYWSVPKGWFPNAVLFRSDEVPDLLRQLRRIPRGVGRARLLALVLSRLPKSDFTADVVVSRQTSAQEDQYLGVVEDSANSKTALFMRYYTASRGDAGSRHASVHRVLIGPPARFVATCHRSGTLKTFRVDSIMNARVDNDERYRAADESVLAAYLSASVDGFNDGGAPMPVSFRVRNPEARWVRNNLLEGMQLEERNDGVRVVAHTTAIGRVARFVIGLGAAAVPETPALAHEVTELARGALSTASPVADGQPMETGLELQRGEQLRSRA